MSTNGEGVSITATAREIYVDRIDTLKEQGWSEVDVDETFGLDSESLRDFWEFADTIDSDVLASITMICGKPEEKYVRGFLQASWVRPMTVHRPSRAIRIVFRGNKDVRVETTEGGGSLIGKYFFEDAKKMVDSMFFF